MTQSKKSKRWSKRKDVIKNKDDVFKEGKATDVIIPVIGKTGVGKSTFINTLLGSETMMVGHDIVSCTAKIQWAVVDKGLAAHIYPKLGDRRLVIVDTPGFDHTYHDDSEILRRIAAWLGSCYANGVKLGGIIYLQNITWRQMEGANRRNLEMFKKLCGTNALGSVILGTTGWEEVRLETGETREAELKSKFWRDMINKGSTVNRFDRSQTTAISIVRHILERMTTDPMVLQIQAELVDQGKYLPQTDAGKEVFYSIEHILETLKDIQIDDAQEKEELQRKVQALEAQIKSLRLPFFTRLKSLFGM